MSAIVIAATFIAGKKVEVKRRSVWRRLNEIRLADTGVNNPGIRGVTESAAQSLKDAKAAELGEEAVATGRVPTRRLLRSVTGCPDWINSGNCDWNKSEDVCATDCGSICSGTVRRDV